MRLSNDLKEFIGLLNASGVEYLIVGAYSLAFHARPRYTGDLDVFVRPTPANAERLVAVLREFGFSDLNISAADFLQADNVIQLGRAPHRIDLLTSISGVSVDSAFANRVSGDLSGVPVHYLDKASLIANKRAVGRPQDLADLDALEN